MPKTAERPQSGTPDSGPTREDLRTAQQVHTLAQMLYGHLASVHPWFNVGPQLGPMGHHLGPMGHHLGPMGHHLGPMGPYAGPPGETESTMVPTPVTWTPGWPMTYGGPYGCVGPTGYSWPAPTGYFGSEFFPRW